MVSGEALHARALAVTMLLEQLCVKGRPHAYALDALTSLLDTLRATAARLQEAVAPGSPLLSAAGLAAGPLVDGPRLTAIVLRAARAVMVCQLSQGALEVGTVQPGGQVEPSVWVWGGGVTSQGSLRSLICDPYVTPALPTSHHPHTPIPPCVLFPPSRLHPLHHPD